VVVALPEGSAKGLIRRFTKEAATMSGLCKSDIKGSYGN
jgi:hypothetical protein